VCGGPRKNTSVAADKIRGKGGGSPPRINNANLTPNIFNISLKIFRLRRAKNLLKYLGGAWKETPQGKKALVIL